MKLLSTFSLAAAAMGVGIRPSVSKSDPTVTTFQLQTVRNDLPTPLVIPRSGSRSSSKSNLLAGIKSGLRGSTSLSRTSSSHSLNRPTAIKGLQFVTLYIGERLHAYELVVDTTKTGLFLHDEQYRDDEYIGQTFDCSAHRDCTRHSSRNVPFGNEVIGAGVASVNIYTSSNIPVAEEHRVMVYLIKDLTATVASEFPLDGVLGLGLPQPSLLGLFSLFQRWCGPDHQVAQFTAAKSSLTLCESTLQTKSTPLLLQVPVQTEQWYWGSSSAWQGMVSLELTIDGKTMPFQDMLVILDLGHLALEPLSPPSSTQSSAASFENSSVRRSSVQKAVISEITLKTLQGTALKMPQDSLTYLDPSSPKNPNNISIPVLRLGPQVLKRYNIEMRVGTNDQSVFSVYA
ncbi:hypothetical protein H4R34_003528 [Dimargaris verticillata]|uniref:Peptidase A1 domain-containing protein n=1 Tax=Dimargaris verticillata TaxID=2761393 RepID=A0A9W8AZV4_9FUNG|nr:hypothetical protein H4R34_003528 [Dimargaris verticillata]